MHQQVGQQQQQPREQQQQGRQQALWASSEPGLVLMQVHSMQQRVQTSHSSNSSSRHTQQHLVPRLVNTHCRSCCNVHCACLGLTTKHRPCLGGTCGGVPSGSLLPASAAAVLLAQAAGQVQVVSLRLSLLLGELGMLLPTAVGMGGQVVG